MAEGAREHSSVIGGKFSPRSPDIKARTREVLHRRPKEVRPTILGGIIDLKNAVNKWLGMNNDVPVIHPVEQVNDSNRIARRRHMTIEEDAQRTKQARELAKEQAAEKTDSNVELPDPLVEMYRYDEAVDGKEADKPTHDVTVPDDLSEKR